MWTRVVQTWMWMWMWMRMILWRKAVILSPVLPRLPSPSPPSPSPHSAPAPPPTAPRASAPPSPDSGPGSGAGSVWDSLPSPSRLSTGSLRPPHP
ncbi:hypothetical protein C8R44DRAFT_795904 [Mycena epipterygia]|nr:hypothetical protein C8R44DRAFT_795904 [Mycena epipterygia]